MNQSVMEFPYNLTKVTSEGIQNFFTSINSAIGMWPARFVLIFLWLLFFHVSKKMKPQINVGQRVTAASFPTLLIAIVMIYFGLIGTAEIIILGIATGIGLFIGREK